MLSQSHRIPCGHLHRLPNTPFPPCTKPWVSLPASFLRGIQSSRLRCDPLQPLLDPLHPTALMAALNDLRDFFQPEKSHNLQLLAKSQVEKAAGRRGRRGPGMSGLGRKGSRVVLRGVAGWHFSASQSLQENKQSPFQTLSLQ